MSLMIDLASLGDLIAAQGTEGDKRAWSRVRAEMDELRRRLDAANEALPLTGGGAERERRPVAIVLDMDAAIAHVFAGPTDARAWLRSRPPELVPVTRYYDCQAIEWHEPARPG